MGFFSLSAEKAQVSKASSSTPGCGACGLHKQCLSPRMGITGEGRKGVFILAEAPGAAEDKRNKQLVGDAGQLLRRELKALGIDLDKDCWKMNAVNCRVPKDKAHKGGGPTDAEISWCHPMVWKEIQEKKPHIIILLGGAALKSLMFGRWKKKLGGISQWRGFTAPDRELGAWVCPTYHPSYVKRSKKDPIVGKIFKQDLEQAVSLLDRDLPPWQDEKESVQVLSGARQIREYLRTVVALGIKYLAWDYETTGIKPHASGQRIVSCSMSYNGFDSAAWLWDEMDEACHLLFKKIIANPDIGLIASNMKYEDNWSVELAGVKPQGWVWDTMLAAHAMDNRSGITSIKFLVYIHLGVLPYDEHVSHLLKSTEKGANALNRIDEINPYDLLIYNGLDSAYEFQVAMLQMEAGYVKIRD